MATPEQPLVTQADLDAYIASYQKAQADQAAALARAQATGMSDQYTQLYGGADIIPGLTQGILSNLGIENPYLPVYSLIGSESVGNNLANERMQFAPTPGVSYRLTNKATGETTTATTPEEIKALIEASNALSAAGGKKADLVIESNQFGGWSPVFTDEPNPVMNTITKLALAGMIAATGAGLLQPGGLGGVSAAGTTGAGATGAGAAGAGTAAGAGSGLVPGALTGANALSFAPIATTAIPAGVGASELVVTALMAKGFTAAQAAALVASGGAAAALSSSAGAGTTTGTTAATNAANTMPPATTTGPELVLTAQQTGSAVPAIVPAATAATTAAATSTTPAATSTTPAPNPAEDLTLTAQTQPTNLLPSEFIAPAAVAAAAAANAAGATTTAAEQAATRTSLTPEQSAAITGGAGATIGAGGVLGTGLSLAQLASITGIGVDLLGKLIGGGGDGGATTPYTSPFGAGPTFAPAARTQVNPNITDYEKYGFGPEALFFSGGQRLNTYTPPATTTTTAQTTSPAAATTPAATTPAATTTNLIDSAAAGGSTDVGTNGSVRLTLTEGASGGSPVILEGGNKGPATPANTGMTQERLDQLQERYDNMRSGEFFNYFKSVNDVLDNYVAKGVITPDIAKQYQSRLETAASTPNATLASLQAAVPMPQISQFIQPTGTRPAVTYTAPTQPITDRSAYINDLYKQLGAQFSQGLLAAPQVQNIQGQLRQAYLNPQSTIEQFQNIFNTGMQQYKPLI